MSSLKKIAAFPESAINWSIDKLPAEERSNLDKTLRHLEELLGEKKRREKE